MKQQELLHELGKIDIGIGTLVTTNERVYEAIAPGANQLREWVQQEQPDVHSDETRKASNGAKRVAMGDYLRSVLPISCWGYSFTGAR